MLVQHRGNLPVVDPSAYVAPTAVLCGDVRVGPRARVLFGAVLSAEDGRVEVGASCVIMENALVRGRAAHPARLGDRRAGRAACASQRDRGRGRLLPGHRQLAVPPGSRLGREVEVRINGVVHVNTALDDGALVPIGWVAVGDPAQVLAPSDHEEIWKVQAGLDFPQTVYGISREASARERMERQAEWFAAHRDDRVLPPS